MRRLENDLSKATDKINRVVEEKTRLQDENAQLKARIIAFEHRLGKTSRNSSKPLRVMVLPSPSRVKGSVPPAVSPVTYVDNFFMLTNDLISPFEGCLSLNLSP